MRRAAMFRSLAVRNYRVYALGQLVSNPGTWMQRIAQDWLVLQLSGGSGIALGLTTALQFLPMLFLGLWGGAMVDRFDKRKLLIGTQATMGVLAVGLGVLATLGAAQVWHVYLFALGLGMITVLDNPGRQAFVPEMVDREMLPNAIALNSASFQLGRVTGPAVAGVLIGLVGSGPVFMVNGLSFAFTIVALLLIRTAELNPTEPVPRGKGQIREGLRYIGGRRDLVLLLVLAGSVQFFGANAQNQIALMVNNVYEAGATAFGVAAASLAVGALAGALLAARRDHPRLKLVLVGAMGFGATQLLAGLMPGYVSFVVVLVPMGVLFMTFVTTLNATFQLSVDPQMRGRVMSMFLLVFMGVAPIGAPVVGLIADAFGPQASLLTGGAVTVVVVGVLTVLLMRARGLSAGALLRRRRGRAAAGAETVRGPGGTESAPATPAPAGGSGGDHPGDHGDRTDREQHQHGAAEQLGVQPAEEPLTHEGAEHQGRGPDHQKAADLRG
ncbi:MFS transporter [Nocardiopsis sp. NPDC006938]|uniref:MFS transporter n=1 Tax=Nocardiopsis sp. NPDC006938 TaxID=3364337 RepID=UPI003684351E